MSRKIVLTLLIFAFVFTNILITMAQNEKIGTFKKSSAVVSIKRSGVYLQEKNIPIYEINSELAICIEDLDFYGYNVQWNNKTRETRINYDGKNMKGTSTYRKNNGSIYNSDVKIYLEEKNIPSYNIGGYSLVKINDLKDFDNIYFVRNFEEEKKEFKLKGKVNLPQGDVAPKGGISGKIILYGRDERHSPYKIREKSFYIKEGQNYAYYEITKNDFLQNGEEVRYRREESEYENTFISYEIDEKYGYISSLFNLSDIYGEYVKWIEEFSVNYDSFDIEILNKATLNGVINLEKECTISGNNTRSIKIYAVNEKNNKTVMKEMYGIPTGKLNIEYSLEVPANNDYYILYEVTVFGDFIPRYGLAAVHEEFIADKGYYKDNGFVKDREQASIVKVGKDIINNLNVRIPMDIPVGTPLAYASKSDIKTYFNRTEINTLNINGNTAIFAKDLKACGLDVKFDSKEKTVEITNRIMDTVSDVNKEEFIHGYVKKTDIKAVTGGNEVNSYNHNGNTVIMINDLSNCGFKVDFDNDSKIINISN